MQSSSQSSDLSSAATPPATPPTAAALAPGSHAWLSQVREEIIDPHRPIIDPHHHLWPNDWRKAYLLEDFWRDTGSGHRIEKTVFVECQASYPAEGPEAFKPLGETEFVARIAKTSRETRSTAPGGAGAVIAGFVGHANLTLEETVLRELLRAHAEKSDGLFRGIRHAGARDANPKALSIPGRAPERLYADPQFRAGVALLGTLGLSYDTWHYHHQNGAYLDLLQATPGTQFILDHFGTPLGVGEYAGRRDEIFAQWKLDIARIAKCPNVVAKLGGLAMPDCGYGWDKSTRPATSDELVAAQQDYYHHAIACFGPQRCMFESNFPVDKRSLSYAVYWNAMKKIAARYSEAEQHAMFYGTAEQIYRL
jgi:L-fuconolactonase